MMAFKIYKIIKYYKYGRHMLQLVMHIILANKNTVMTAMHKMCIYFTRMINASTYKDLTELRKLQCNKK